MILGKIETLSLAFSKMPEELILTQRRGPQREKSFQDMVNHGPVMKYYLQTHPKENLQTQMKMKIFLQPVK